MSDAASDQWTRLEVEAIVADYLDMLQAELAGLPFNKAEHNRTLMRLLPRRSRGSIEFKHANISAVMIESGLPYISGYKPRANYQRMLAEVVLAQISAAPELVRAVSDDVELVPTIELPSFEELLSAFVDPPAPAAERKKALHEPKVSPFAERRAHPPVNYLEREAANRNLGFAGEEFVLRVEQARLVSLGHERLAGRIDHVSRSRGDGLGYDILSFDPGGREKLIEVKTTKHGRETPFFVSKNEVHVSEIEEDRYHLYRVFAFRTKAKLFTLPGALSATCELEPTTYRAQVA